MKEKSPNGAVLPSWRIKTNQHGELIHPGSSIMIFTAHPSLCLRLQTIPLGWAVRVEIVRSDRLLPGDALVLVFSIQVPYPRCLSSCFIPFSGLHKFYCAFQTETKFAKDIAVSF